MSLDDFVEAEMKRTRKERVKRYVITSAQYGATPNRAVSQSLQNYAHQTNSELLVIPMNGANIQDTDLGLHPEIQKTYKVVDGRLKLNNKIAVERMHIRPQQIDPVTGLARFVQGDVTTIFESSKQRMKVIPNSTNSLPKVLMSSGAVTQPRYNVNNRIGRIALKDHTYGAIVVEVTGKNSYHFRQLRATGTGSFVDMGVKYTPDSVESTELEALVLGDYHSGDTNKKVRKATFDLISTQQPARVIIHDFFNSHSISHHDQNKSVYRAVKASQGRITLSDELKQASKELRKLYELVEAYGGELVVVKSNHDEHLDRYIEEARFINEPHNYKDAVKIAAEMVEGGDALSAGLSLYWPELSDVEGITFLSRTDDYKVWGYQLGVHGDKGVNGSRGSNLGLENAWGKSISGHRHSPEILRNTYVVATSTDLNLDYNAGFASSWMNTHGMLYSGGFVQMINVINGKWRA